MRLSYSAINTYQNCPLMYKFGYIDKMPTKPNEKMWFAADRHERGDHRRDESRHFFTNGLCVSNRSIGRRSDAR